MGERAESSHRTTHGQPVGRDTRGSRGIAGNPTPSPQGHERGIRRVREQDTRVAFQAHDRGVSHEQTPGSPSADRHPTVLQHPRFLYREVSRYGSVEVGHGRHKDQIAAVPSEDKRGPQEIPECIHDSPIGQLSHRS